MYSGIRVCSMMKETLRCLCSNGWCYGIFWGFDQRNSLLLTVKDAYYQEQTGPLIDNMLMQVHVLGRGAIGQTAFTRSHKWMFSSSSAIPDMLKDDSELDFDVQFAMGIKTIALVSVEPWGVVQLGSTHEVLESKEFIDHVKQVFDKLELSENEPSSSDSRFLDSSVQFATLLSSSAFEDFADSTGFMNLDDHNSNALQLDQLLFDTGSSFDCSALTSSWSRFPSGISSYECSTSSSLNPLAKDGMSVPDSTMLFNPNDTNAPRPVPSGLLTLDDLFHENACPVYDFSQWLPPLPFPSNPTGLVPVPKLSGHTSPIDDPPTNSMQSSVTTTAFRANGIDRLLNSLGGAEPGCQRPQSWIEPLVPDLSAEKAFGSKVGASNSLFSRLGLDQLLDGGGSSSCSFVKSDQTQSAAKRRKIDTWSSSQVPECETSVKEGRNCVGDSSNMCAGSTRSSKRQQEPVKSGKKKAKPGTRPRPKDRQMIQDRLAELRGLIPNGEKMSIDRLLERTIRHLNFMSSLAKHSESLKQVDETKSSTVQKGCQLDDNSGVTWACEVGEKSMVCPLIVEDLTTPGQMLIEILYQDCGFFLEIVDVIRGFGLTILKGVMEACATKIWARFVVDAKGNRHGMRHEIFSSLIQLLQMTGGNSSKPNQHFGNNVGSSEPFFNNHQSVTSFPINLADTIQCANL